MAVRRAHRIAIDPFGGDLRARASFHRLIDADNERAIGHERRDEQAQQGSADGER